MSEWTNQWNPFNSAKILLWRQHLEHCAIDDYLPPIVVNIDPSNRCMYDCPHCNAFDMISGKGNNMSEEHMIKLIDFLADWRDSTEHYTPGAACVSGGGEPYMNHDINAMLERMYEKDMEIGVITAGFPMTDEDIEIGARTSRWFGFSLDAGSKEVYNRVKGIKNSDAFDKVVETMRKMVKKVDELGTNCDVAYKFLITPENALDIYNAVKLAKDIGVKDVHIRPVCWDNITKKKGEGSANFEGLIDDINKQITESRKLETKDFRIYGIKHKYSPSFTKKVEYSKCWTSSILPTFSADGNVHLCADQRGDPDFVLCRHDPDPSEILTVWNTDYHHEKINNIDVNKCPKCTVGPYNEVVEQVIINDNMTRRFP